MKKIWLLSPFILSLLSSPLCGDEGLKSNTADKNEVASNYTFSQKHRGWKEKACKTCTSPAQNYRLPVDFNGWNSYAEALIWQIQEQGSYFVASPNEHSTVDLVANQTQLLGEVNSLSFDWNGGLRLGLGYTFFRDSWQLLGQYTWFSTEGDNSFSVRFPTGTTTQWLMPTFTDIEGGGLHEAESSANFSYQMADLLLARRFLVKDQIQLNFSLGATGGYIRENSHISYENIGNNTVVVNHWGFGGGGLRTGFDANWHISRGFGFFGKFSYAAILGQYGTRNRIAADGPGALGSGLVSSPRIAHTEATGLYLMPTTQIALGFDWTRSFANCWISGVRLAVTGEFNHLSNLHQIFKDPIGSVPPTFGKLYVRDVSSVYMYGADIRLGADF